MFRITFSAETQEDDVDTSEIGMTLNFPEQPAWSELTDRFLDFLKAQGYIFDYNARLDVVTPEDSGSTSEDMEPNPWDDVPTEEEVKPRKSGGKGKNKK